MNYRTNNTLIQSFTNNSLNELNGIGRSGMLSVAGTVDVLGVANPTAGVTVNGNRANRKGDYFHWPLTVANSSA